MSNYQTADREGHGLGYTMPQLEQALGEARRERDAARRAVATGVETEDALRAEIGRLREALALIVGAFTNGVYCGSCGEPVDDCGCVINNGREALH